MSSKYLTAFSDFRLPANEADFLPTSRYVRYLEEYANKHGLWKHIHLSAAVTTVTPHPTELGHYIELRERPRHNTTIRFQDRLHYHAVAVCTGVNRTPYLPGVPGLISDIEASRYDISNSAAGIVKNSLSGHSVKIMHSMEYKGPSPADDNHTILVLGVGETAMDIGALEVSSCGKSITSNKRVVMCHRDGFTFQPKIVPEPLRAGGKSGGPDPNHPNKPIDCTPASLFDTAYVPPVIQRGPWLWAVYDFFIKRMAWMISGTTAGFDQWVGGIDPCRFHADAVIFCKSAKAIPYISEQYRSQSMLNKLRSWLINVPIQPTGGRKIELAPWPSHFDENGVVHFRKNDRPESKRMEADKSIKPDLVIFATGYRRVFPFLTNNKQKYPSLDDATTRGIYRHIEDGIAYIGFVRPALGKLITLQTWTQETANFRDRCYPTPGRVASTALDPRPHLLPQVPGLLPQELQAPYPLFRRTGFLRARLRDALPRPRARLCQVQASCGHGVILLPAGAGHGRRTYLAARLAHVWHRGLLHLGHGTEFHAQVSAHWALVGRLVCRASGEPDAEGRGVGQGGAPDWRWRL